MAWSKLIGIILFFIGKKKFIDKDYFMKKDEAANKDEKNL